MDVKKCSKCGETKPRDQYNRDRRDGLRSNCRACHQAAARAWRQANREKKRATDRAWCEANRVANEGVDPYDGATLKTCSSCRGELSRTEFSPDPSKRDGLNNRCRPCIAAAKKKNTCPDCGAACRGDRCSDCSDYGPGTYNATTIGRRSDRWGHKVHLYLKVVTDLSGNRHLKVGIGTAARVAAGGYVLKDYEMPLALALYYESHILETHGRYSVDADLWPKGLGGRTECLTYVPSELPFVDDEQVEAWLAERSSDEEVVTIGRCGVVESGRGW